MNKAKIHSRAGVLGYGYDDDYQAYIVELDFVDDDIKTVKEWDKFFSEVNNSKFENLVRITIEKL